MRKSKQARGKVPRLSVLRTQRDVLRDVMLSATECGAWYTLEELAALTRYGETSISAQLRHLRKPENGGFLLEKRPRRDVVVRGSEIGTVWEYQLRRGPEPATSRAAFRGYGENLSVQPAVC